MYYTISKISKKPTKGAYLELSKGRLVLHQMHGNIEIASAFTIPNTVPHSRFQNATTSANLMLSQMPAVKQTLLPSAELAQPLPIFADHMDDDTPSTSSSCERSLSPSAKQPSRADIRKSEFYYMGLDDDERVVLPIEKRCSKVGQRAIMYVSTWSNKWWSRSLEDFEVLGHRERLKLSSVGKIMETTLGQEKKGKDACTRCQEKKLECHVFSEQGRREVKYSTGVCARCRIAPGRCSFSIPSTKEASNRNKRSTRTPSEASIDARAATPEHPQRSRKDASISSVPPCKTKSKIRLVNRVAV